MTVQFKRIDGTSVEISAEALQAFKSAFLLWHGALPLRIDVA